MLTFAGYTAAVVALAKRTGVIDQVRPVIDQLRQQGFRLSEKLYEEVLRAAGEWPPATD